MKRRTFYIIAAVWFILLIIVIACSFLPVVDPVTQEKIRKYLVFVVLIGALCLLLIRRKVK